MGACFCMGPQNGEPFCPCKMRQMNDWVKIIEKSDVTKFVFPRDTDGSFDVVKAAINEVNNRKNR